MGEICDPEERGGSVTMLTQAVKDELKAIVGEERYFDSPEDLLLYSYDAFMVRGCRKRCCCRSARRSPGS